VDSQLKGYKIIRQKSKSLKKVFFACNSCDFQIDLGMLGVGAHTTTARTLGAAEMNKHISSKHPEAEPNKKWGF
jgi:hypothetical protein